MSDRDFSEFGQSLESSNPDAVANRGDDELTRNERFENIERAFDSQSPSSGAERNRGVSLSRFSGAEATSTNDAEDYFDDQDVVKLSIRGIEVGIRATSIQELNLKGIEPRKFLKDYTNSIGKARDGDFMAAFQTSIEARKILDKLLADLLEYPRWMLNKLDKLNDRQINDLYEACFGFNSQKEEVNEFNESFPDETNVGLSDT